MRGNIIAPLEVKNLLEVFGSEVRDILREKLIGIYVFGSVVMGDFSEYQSDVDFVVLLDAPLKLADGKKLQSLHKKLCAIKFGDRLEGEYVAISALREGGVKGRVARCEKGELTLNVKSEITAKNVFDLRENAIVLYGPDPKSIFPRVPKRLVTEALLENLMEANKELKCRKIEDPNQLSSGILDVCRILYALKSGGITSKTKAAIWALKILPEKWKPMVKHALAIRSGKKCKNGKTLSVMLPQFVAYVLNSCKACKE